MATDQRGLMVARWHRGVTLARGPRNSLATRVLTSSSASGCSACSRPGARSISPRVVVKAHACRCEAGGLGQPLRAT
jgi:hypothetical protein